MNTVRKKVLEALKDGEWHTQFPDIDPQMMLACVREGLVEVTDDAEHRCKRHPEGGWLKFRLTDLGRNSTI